MIKSRLIEIAVNLKNAVTSVMENTAYNTYEFEDRLWLFDELLALTADSPMAALCLSRLESFLYAQGFNDPKSADFAINPFQKANAVLMQAVKAESRFESYALVVRNDISSLLPTSVYVQPIEKITKRTDGSYLINPRRRLEGLYNQVDDIHYQPYQSDISKSEFRKIYEYQVKKYGRHLGRILYIYDPSPGQGEHYAVPSYYSADSDLMSDAEYARLQLFKVKNDFDASVIIQTAEFSDQPNVDASGLATLPSDLDIFERELRKFTAKDPQERRSIMHLQAPTPEMQAKVTPLNTLNGAQDMNATRFGIQSAVARAMQVPGVLVGLYQPGSIGDTKKIADEIALFNASLELRKFRLQRGFELIYPDMDWTIGAFNPINYIPTEVWAKMTDDEIRKAGGLPVLEKKAPLRDRINILDESVKAKLYESMSDAEIRSLANLDSDELDNVKETLNGDQIRSLVEISEKVKANTLPADAAIEIIKLSFGISRPRAIKLIGSIMGDPLLTPTPTTL